MAERCPDSGCYVGLAPGHLARCAACGKRVPVTSEHKLCNHMRPSPPFDADCTTGPPGIEDAGMGGMT